MANNKHYALTDKEAAAIRDQVMVILRAHRGSGYPITGLRIARKIGHRSDRKVRIVIQQLIADGEPIAASVSEPVGYYLIETSDEAEAYAAVLRSRAVKTFERLRDFQRAAKSKFGVPFQPVLLTTEEQ